MVGSGISAVAGARRRPRAPSSNRTRTPLTAGSPPAGCWPPRRTGSQRSVCSERSLTEARQVSRVWPRLGWPDPIGRPCCGAWNRTAGCMATSRRCLRSGRRRSSRCSGRCPRCGPCCGARNSVRSTGCRRCDSARRATRCEPATGSRSGPTSAWWSSARAGTRTPATRWWGRARCPLLAILDSRVSGIT